MLPLLPRVPLPLEPLLRVTTGLEALPLPEPEPVLTGTGAEPLLEVVTAPAYEEPGDEEDGAEPLEEAPVTALPETSADDPP